MFSLICGFLWGCFCTLLLIDLFTALINIVWWIYLILFFVLLINSIVLRVYLYVSDYKGSFCCFSFFLFIVLPYGELFRHTVFYNFPTINIH